MTSKHDALVAREKKVLFQTYGRYPLAIAAAKGARMTDLDGKQYVDLLAGIAVANLGHSHPELLEAMASQAEKLLHVSNLFYQSPQVELAELLLSTCACDRAFFCNSGAEANEAAIKLARRYMRTVRYKDAGEIITLSGSFHGRTLATLTATGQAGRIKEGYEPLPAGFSCVPFGDIDALRAAVTQKTAAVLMEMIQGEGGVLPLPESYVREAADICREAGCLFMVDEVQTGMCRTGRFWAHQHYGVEPDVFTTSKALANGLPMGAMLAKEHVAKGFVPGSHATTFGGGGVVSAVAAKVVEIMKRDDIAGRARDLGKLALDAFRAVQAKHPDRIAGVRGLGLMIGIVLSGPGETIHADLRQRGFVCNLAHGTVLRLLPPLTIAAEDLLAFAQALDDILGSDKKTS
ncbi:acetylornithine aminotransferase apoenzyme [Humidesulfovibrio mexicanus]|uniref:Acetylornithine aminotransferase n=1 Tax=Humidesulfovibrio mexicanus TaxID=147047 RepID=A0A239CYP4_9BACT|nr:aspartate aminotransferase family protein [Humidesulfovibrio mexicanus]SNS25345.1 acetylornithine aminotransferase apoenzyme [Humidesulfovibrio mexicanus]